ncbi:MAG: hypothetical protein V3T19_00320, partial [Acidiferrobacterales bacterium]
ALSREHRPGAAAIQGRTRSAVVIPSSHATTLATIHIVDIRRILRLSGPVAARDASALVTYNTIK